MSTPKILRLILNRGQLPLCINVNFLAVFLIFFIDQSNKMAENLAFQQLLKFGFLQNLI